MAQPRQMVSTDRFPKVTRPLPDDRSKHQRFRQIRCSKTGCNAVGEFHEGAGIKNLPPEVAAKKFRSMGWYVGQKQSEDLCPTHARSANRRADEYGKAAKVVALRRKAPATADLKAGTILGDRGEIFLNKAEADAAGPGVDIPLSPGSVEPLGKDPPHPLFVPPERTVNPSKDILEQVENVSKRVEALAGYQEAQTAQTAGWKAALARGDARPIKRGLNYELYEEGKRWFYRLLPLTTSPQETPTMAEPAKITPETRTATREDNRRIRDHLDAHYDEEHQRWRGDGSDQKASDAPEVPRLWVSRLREELYGPDRNEANDENRQAVAKLEKQWREVWLKVEDHAKQGLDLMDQMAAIRKGVEELKAKL